MPKILIVDDDPVLIERTVKFFKLEDWGVLGASNGLEALRMLDRTSDAVVLDLRMPVMDGETALAEIKKRPELENVCVVVLTAFGEVDSAVRAIRHGAYQYLQKPFHLPDLQRILISGMAWQKAHALRRKILGSFDKTARMREIRSIIEETIHPAGLYIFLLSPDGRVIGGDPPELAQWSEAKPRHFVRQILESKEPIFEHDQGGVAGWDPVIPGARSLLAAPVPGEKAMVGIIDIESQDPEAFDRNWVDVLRHLADLTGIAFYVAEKAEEVAALRGERDSLQKLQMFARELSHLIATPVHVIKLQTQTLIQKELAAAETSTRPLDFLTDIRRRVEAIERNVETIEKVRDWLRDVAPDIQVRKKPFELLQAIDLCLEEVAAELREKGIEVAVSGRPEEKLVIEGDAGLIKYSVQCVMRNAIEAIEERRARQHSETKAEPALPESFDRITLTLDTGDPARVSLSIQDTGIGITPENLGRIFQPLFTTKKEAERGGMGLFSVRSILNKHDGSIQARSEPGQGATFTIILPRR